MRSGVYSGMNDFEWAVTFVLEAEGGFQNNPKDSGNYRPDGTLVGTKYGISAAAYPEVDIPNLTKDEAKSIYHDDYWLPVMEHVNPWVSPATKLNVFDFGVNAGVARSLRFWEKSNESNAEFTAARIRFYSRLERFTTFGRGWMNRIADYAEYSAGHDNRVDRVILLFGPTEVPIPFVKKSIVRDKLYLRVF